jgi:RNA ligase (TIGR02306 family)
MRKLASLQKIAHVRPIEGADRIEAVGILGWECVSKKGEFQAGDPCVYFEIDSLLPEDPRYEFLKTSSYRKDLKKYRLRTVKLKGQLSQGLVLPLSLFPEAENFLEGQDLTDILGIEKYEPPVPAQIQGDARTFSWPIGKTDEPRIQSEEGRLTLEKLKGNPYYISLKLDGTSCTFIVDPRDDEYHVCGRNYSYKWALSHSFWIVNDRYNIEERLRSLRDIAIQGEVVGPGIQKNKMGLKNVDFYVFNVVRVSTSSRLPIDESISVAESLGLKFVPILERGESFSYSDKELLDKAKIKYRDFFPDARRHQEAEGIVVRSLCGSLSFKAINNEFLLKGEE